MHNNIMAAGSKDHSQHNALNRRYSTMESRLQQGESLNVQDVKTNLFWEFGKFTSRDGESMESYYSRFYKLILASYYKKVSEEDSDPEQAQRDKDMQKNFDTLAMYFKGSTIHQQQPSNSLNSRNKTEDTTQGSPVVQQTGIQCFNCKGFGHYAKECRKPKRVKDYTYHKEKMMMCKQAEQGVPLQAEES
ncbi:uncharacterized mitochondrial protein-like protein [Tanacetum coccineum]